MSWNLNVLKFDHTSPLHAACENKNDQIVHLLLKNGANVNSFSKLETSYTLIGLPGKTNQNFIGTSPLYTVCKYGEQKIAKVLIEHGADVNFCSQREGTPPCAACDLEITDL